ncbi:MAG: DUF2306 domain-containing protein [Saprospiraceae bacterium]|nr:DUF2306 domain-containing protein [Saprospiraceae bacterium]
MKDNLLKLIGYAFAAWILIFTGIMVTKVLPYLSFERAINFLGTKPNEVLDKQYFMWAFYIHITSSVFSIGGGIFQFFPKILRGYPKVHQWIGKIYIGSILLFAAPSGLVLAAFANGGLAARVGFTLQCVVWWLTTYAAWHEIMKKNYLRHTEMMLRSYAVTIAAMSLRTESYFMVYIWETKPIETYLTVTWLSWVGNLLIAEMLIYLGFAKKLISNLNHPTSNI